MRQVLQGMERRDVEPEMKKVAGNKICEECGTVMFRRGVDTDMNKTMVGWSCSKCHTTKWDEMK